MPQSSRACLTVRFLRYESNWERSSLNPYHLFFSASLSSTKQTEFSDTDTLIIARRGEKQTRLWQLESLWGGVISHPGGSRLNQLLIKLAPWQCWGNVAHCQGNSRRLHGNQAAMGPHVKVLTHGKLTRKEKSTERLEIQQGHEHCVHFIGIS